MLYKIFSDGTLNDLKEFISHNNITHDLLNEFENGLRDLYAYPYHGSKRIRDLSDEDAIRIIAMIEYLFDYGYFDRYRFHNTTGDLVDKRQKNLMEMQKQIDEKTLTDIAKITMNYL